MTRDKIWTLSGLGDESHFRIVAIVVRLIFDLFESVAISMYTYRQLCLSFCAWIASKPQLLFSRRNGINASDQ